MSRFTRRLSYNDFFRTGQQDCGNAIDLDDFDYALGSPEKIVDGFLSELKRDRYEARWIEQHDDFEGLDPRKAYAEWLDGWRSCAIRLVRQELNDRSSRMGDRAEHNPGRGGLLKPPINWTSRPVPKDDLICYATRSDALKKFLDWNRDLIDNYGGENYQVGASEFDAINHKYGLTGKRAARTIADAVWYAMPLGKPYCLDRIDLEALNGTSPAREAGAQFHLPDYVYEKMLLDEEAALHATQAEEMASAAPQQDEEEELPSWVTDTTVYDDGDGRPADDDEPAAAVATPVSIPEPVPDLEPEPEFLTLAPEPEKRSREAYLEAYIVPSKIVADTHEPWMDEMMWVSKERRPLVAPTANPACGCEPQDNPSPDDLASALMFAEMLASTMNKHGLRAKAWSHHSVGARVYIGKGFLSISRGGDATNYLRNQVTLGEWELYPDQRRKYKAALEEYRKLVGEHHDAQWAKIDPKDNPSSTWITKVIANNYADMEEEVPDKWLPKVSSLRSTGGRKVTATMKKYGCGNYGCVLPTHDPKVVLKVTTDETEAQFATELADSLSARVVVKYHKAVSVPEKHKGHETYLLWRDAADRVGELLDMVKERGGDQRAAFAAIKRQHDVADKAYDALAAGKDATELLAKWKQTLREMGKVIPEVRKLTADMITVLDKDGVLFGDVHDGNLGLVNGRWLIIDPGNIAVISEEA